MREPLELTLSNPQDYVFFCDVDGHVLVGLTLLAEGRCTLVGGLREHGILLVHPYGTPEAKRARKKRNRHPWLAKNGGMR